MLESLKILPIEMPFLSVFRIWGDQGMQVDVILSYLSHLHEEGNKRYKAQLILQAERCQNLLRAN